MITGFSKERSTFHSLTGGGSYPHVRNEGEKSYARISSFESSPRAARRARRTVAISLQASHLLRLLPVEVSAPNRDSAVHLGQAVVAGGVQTPKWKRALDLTCTILSMPVWLVAMGGIAMWIKLTSPGPVFYRQTRVGLGGRQFTILKFRSMRTNSETTTHTAHVEKLIQSNDSMVKLDSLGDSRVIPGGCTLRASGLDELPQIFNVLRGEMSLVGPRPCLPEEFQRYDDWHKGRVYVTPGLTGYWQVSGKNKTSFKQMIELDLIYASRMSLGMDLAVMLATVPALLLQFIEARSRCVRNELRKSECAHAPRQTFSEGASQETMETSVKTA